MDTNPNILRIESDSTPGTFYSVNTETLTCTCPIFSKKLKFLPLDDPDRFCKHLVQALYKTTDKEFLEGSVKTVSIQKKRGFQFFEVVDDLDTVEYFHLKGQVDKASIEAIIRVKHTVILYTINGSKSYSIDMAPRRQESSVNAGDHWSITLTISSDLTDNFPKAYWFMEKAVLQWLKDEYDKINQAG